MATYVVSRDMSNVVSRDISNVTVFFIFNFFEINLKKQTQISKDKSLSSMVLKGLCRLTRFNAETRLPFKMEQETMKGTFSAFPLMILTV